MKGAESEGFEQSFEGKEGRGSEVGSEPGRAGERVESAAGERERERESTPTALPGACAHALRIRLRQCSAVQLQLQCRITLRLLRFAALAAQKSISGVFCAFCFHSGSFANASLSTLNSPRNSWSDRYLSLRAGSTSEGRRDLSLSTA